MVILSWDDSRRILRAELIYVTSGGAKFLSMEGKKKGEVGGGKERKRQSAAVRVCTQYSYCDAIWFPCGLFHLNFIKLIWDIEYIQVF